jgi:hypothetical protein
VVTRACRPKDSGPSCRPGLRNPQNTPSPEGAKQHIVPVACHAPSGLNCVGDLRSQGDVRSALIAMRAELTGPGLYSFALSGRRRNHRKTFNPGSLMYVTFVCTRFESRKTEMLDRQTYRLATRHLNSML